MEGGTGGSGSGVEEEGGRGVGATEGGLEGGGWEEVESRCSRSCCCSNIFSSAVLHLMRVGRGTLGIKVCLLDKRSTVNLFF